MLLLLWLCLPSVLYLCWDQVTHLTIEEYLISLPWETLWFLLQNVVSYYLAALWSIYFIGSSLQFVWIWAESIDLYTLQFCYFYQQTLVTKFHWNHKYQYHNIAFSMSDRWCGMHLPTILVQDYMGFTQPKNFPKFSNYLGLLRYCLVKSNFPFLLFNVTSGLQLVVNTSISRLSWQ